MSTAYSAPISGSGGTLGAYPVFLTPVAISVARGFQLLVALLIMVLGGLLMHGLVMGPYAFAFVCGLFTLIIALYAILTEKVQACRRGYNNLAILSLDLLMVVFWLSAMAAVAHLRGTFQYSTYAECYNNGDAINSNFCYTYKRDLAERGLSKRAAVAGKVALAEMSAIAGLSALELLLFVATFAYLAHQLRLHRRAVKAGVASNDAGVVEMKGHFQPAPDPVYDSTAYSAPPPGSAPAPLPYSAPGQYQPQPVQSYGFAQPSSASTVPGQTPYDPHAYPTPFTPSQTRAPPPGPGPAQVLAPKLYSAEPAVNNPEPYRSASGYPISQ